MAPRTDRFDREANARLRLADELTVCLACRACASRCGVFDGLFDLADRAAMVDAAMMSPLAQDRLVDACNLGGDCLDGCPQPDAIDIPAALLALRSARPVTTRWWSGRRRQPGCSYGEIVDDHGNPVGSCGANALLAGDSERYRAIVERTCSTAAAVLAGGGGLHAPHPSCARTLATYAPSLLGAGDVCSADEIDAVSRWARAAAGEGKRFQP